MGFALPHVADVLHEQHGQQVVLVLGGPTVKREESRARHRTPLISAWATRVVMVVRSLAQENSRYRRGQAPLWREGGAASALGPLSNA